MFVLQLFRLALGPVALQAQLVDAGRAQQLWIIAPVRIVAGETALFKRGLMQVGFRLKLGLIRMAAEARSDRIGSDETGRLAGPGYARAGL